MMSTSTPSSGNRAAARNGLVVEIHVPRVKDRPPLRAEERPRRSQHMPGVEKLKCHLLLRPRTVPLRA